MAYAKITGTGSYLPQQILSNKQLEEIVDTTDEWIQQRVGIKQRHIAAAHETSSFMASRAAEEALSRAGIEANQIGLIIVGTTTPDNYFPSVACLVQHALGITNECAAFDVSAACSGFMYALSIADQYIKSGGVEYALVIGVDALSRLVDWEDRSTCVLFGDGAGAAVLQRSKEPGILGAHLHANGFYQEQLFATSSLWHPDQPDVINMNGHETYKLAVTKLAQIVATELEDSQLTVDDVDWLIPHQANLRIIKAAAKRLNMPMDKVIVTVDKHGNTSAASVPLALHEAVTSGRLQPGQHVLLEAFGAGFTWGSALIKY